jgi:hypothetical protein
MNLDIGGGFPAPYDNGAAVPLELAKVINAELERLFPKDMEILAEPGRFLVATAGYAVATVVGKAVRDGKQCYYIDDGVYHTYSGVIFDHCKYPIRPSRRGRRRSVPCSARPAMRWTWSRWPRNCPTWSGRSGLQREHRRLQSRLGRPTSTAFPPATVVHINYGVHVDAAGCCGGRRRRGTTSTRPTCGFRGSIVRRARTTSGRMRRGTCRWWGGYGGKAQVFSNLDLLLARRDAGELCTGSLYTVNFMANMGEMDGAYILDFLDNVSRYTNVPNVRFVTIGELTNVWAAEYGGDPSHLPWRLTEDLDGDGMNDGWEVTNFCGISAADGESDGDGDGQADRDEYVAGTDPGDAGDRFELIGANGRGLAVWTAVTGRMYTVEVDGGAGWVPTGYSVTGAAPLHVWTNLFFTPHSWCRVRVEMP